jgi:alpha-tubulin suppressor-like RCC1 family protein
LKLKAFVIGAAVVAGLSLPAATAGAGVSVGLAGPASSTYAWGNIRDVGPVKTQLTGEVGIDAGNYDSLLIEPSGDVLEFAGDTQAAHAETVPDLSHVVATADADQYFLAISSPAPIVSGRCPDSTVWRWSDGKAASEVTALDGLGVVQIAAGADHQFALTCTGKVYVWGVGPLAMGGDGHFKEPTLNPQLTALTGGTSVGVLIDAGSDIGGMLVNGQVYMWGSNSQGQCGCGTTGSFIVSPTRVKQKVSFKTISVGGDQSYNGQVLAIDGSGRAWCWGAALDGQCGLGTSNNVDLPTRVPGQTSVAQVAAGGAYSLFLGTNGHLWGSGIINDKTSTSNQLRPVKVFSGVASVSAGAEHALVVGTRPRK